MIEEHHIITVLQESPPIKSSAGFPRGCFNLKLYHGKDEAGVRP